MSLRRMLRPAVSLHQRQNRVVPGGEPAQQLCLLYRVLVGAAESDPDAAALLADRTRHRAAGQELIARSLARSGALRSTVREADAADIIHALMSPEVYQLLVAERGWQPERYEQWLTQILIDQLMPR
ncbi:hypothetical protein FHX44_118150 [Pseudonocardia hierapolitana]|uniref:TetR family transcriptional regulator n=1 Tax=Pseudonocardia hierapolitana TaxID=1128676 RepID=A0A561T521_9PSEU|nr:hypothetical protein [Pseudonocardia hierapolitana]TWF82205.1 hypothetical protein FHX44_118150 [Pseudonocardia hierapolitana]